MKMIANVYDSYSFRKNAFFLQFSTMPQMERIGQVMKTGCLPPITVLVLGLEFIALADS
jgi:hypothetical protein